MIQNLKVTDGDMLILSFGANSSQDFVNRVHERVKTWLKQRGLNNVEIMITATSEFNISKLTVNDVFEQEVLNGNKRD